MKSLVQTINPADEEVLAEYEPQSTAEVREAIESSAEAFEQWRRTPLATRMHCLEEFASAAQSARLPLSELMTREMGKPIKDSLAEIDKCVTSCRTLIEQYPKWQTELNYSMPGGFSVRREPLGVLLGIMPWNFPLWQVVRFVAPALLGGNSILLKHAPNTWGSAQFIEGLFSRAFPEHLYINLRVDVAAIDDVIKDPQVRGVSLTGSVRAGRSVATMAGTHLKKAVLELGGSDAYVILDDADLQQAAQVCVASRLQNAGQSCVAAKRFIVTRKNANAFSEKMRELLTQVQYGDPLLPNTVLGPLARKDLREQLHSQVERSVQRGARLALGGQVPAGKGYFYPPSLLTGVQVDHPAFNEELFGPVAAVIEASSEEQAMALANQTAYGLGGAIFSRDQERARSLATNEMQAGMVFINDFVRSHALAPFGGIKDSGIGRELGKEGCFEFTNIKTIYVKPDGR